MSGFKQILSYLEDPLNFTVFSLLPISLCFLYVLSNILVAKILKEKTHHISYLKIFFQFFFISISFFAVSAINIFILGEMNDRISPKRIIWASNLCAKIDKKIFDINLPFWFQNKENDWKNFFDFLSFPLVESYKNLTVAISLVLLFGFIANFSIFKKTLFSLAIITTISLPIWFFIPAYTPMDFYQSNLLNQSFSKEIETDIANYQPNKTLNNFLDELKTISGKKSFGVSTFPSMHIGWSIIILYFSFKLWRYSLFLIIPYVILNGISTVFTLQHYGVDIISGVAVAIISIWLSKFIKHKKDKELQDMFRIDLVNFSNFIQLSLKIIKKRLF